MKSVIAALSVLALFSSAAIAEEDAPPANIAGMWVFVANITEGCTFTGQATLTPDQDDARNYACEITARQSCPSLGIEYLVRQSCVATLTGQQISVRSKIKEFLEGTPTSNYFPDNFSLFIQNSSHMNGALISGGNANQAVWTRPEGGIS